MAAAVVKFQVFTFADGRHIDDSKDLEPIFKTISVSSDGSDNGLKISESSGKFNFNAKVLGGIGNGTAAGEALSYSQRGVADGVASLDSGGKVPAGQLPSYVDDVLEYANLAAFPGTGETGKIYVAIDTSKCYRWTGSVYVEVSPSEVNSVFGRTGVVTATAGDYTATQITNTPAGTISAVTVQAALNELDSEKASTGYADAKVADAIADGVTTIAPSQNAVFDALALKASITYVDGKVIDSIADADTTHAPSRNAVFDALALKANLADVTVSYSTYTNSQGAGVTVGQIAFQNAFGEAVLLEPAHADLKQGSLLLVVRDATIADTADGTYYEPGATVGGYPTDTFVVGLPVYPAADGSGGIQQDLTGYVAGDKIWMLGYPKSGESFKFLPVYEGKIGA